MSFYTRVASQVANMKESFGYPNDGTAFGHFIIRECFYKIIDFGYDGTDIDEFIQKHIVDMANDLGNDAIFVNQKNREIIVFQFKYSERQLLSTSEIKKNKEFVDWLLGINADPLTPNHKLQGIIDEEISSVLTPENKTAKNYSISFYYIDKGFDGTIKTDIKSLFNNYRQKQIDFQVKCYNYDELEKLHDDVEIPQNEITLKIVRDEYFVKKINFYDDIEPSIETPVETMVTSIIAGSLKPIVEEEKEQILALNVRYFKGANNDINSKIKKEYSKGEKSNFWILNNGINAVCEDFCIDGEWLKIKNFQIINGGQTAKTLTTIVCDLPDDVQILMRLTKIKDLKQTSKISMGIAIASNSQNAISARDLHSGDRIQRKIWDILDSAGIFYDKKDGEWETLSNKTKYKNPLGTSPRHLKISNTDFGKTYLSFYLQIPVSTVGRDKLVFFEDKYNEIFNMTVSEDDQFYKLMLAYRIAERIHKIKTERERNFEILQSSYISEILVALSGMFFFKDSLSQIESVEKLIERLQSVKGQPHIIPTEQYSLNLDDVFDDFIIKVINASQYLLDVKKQAKADNNEEWMANDTSKWLKKDGTYKDIYKGVLKRLKQE